MFFSTKEDTEKSYEEKQESQKSMNLGSSHEKCCVHNSSGRTTNRSYWRLLHRMG